MVFYFFLIEEHYWNLFQMMIRFFSLLYVFTLSTCVHYIWTIKPFDQPTLENTLGFS